MGAPFLSHIEQVRALKGEALVTYPYSDIDYPVTERVRSGTRAKVQLPFLDPEPDTVRFADLVLVEQREISTDRTLVEMWHRYERMPTPAQESERLDPDGGVVTVQRWRNIAADIAPSEAIQYLGTDGSGASFNLTFTAGVLTAIAIVSGGSGYPDGSVVRISGNGTGAKIATTVTAGVITAVSVTDGGSGYSGFVLAGVYRARWERHTKEQEASSSLFATDVFETRYLPGTAIESSRVDEDGVILTVRRTLKASEDIEPGETWDDPTWTRITKEPVTALVAYEISESRSLPGPEKVESAFDPRSKRPVRVTKQLVANATVPATSALLNAEINGYATAIAMTGIVTTTCTSAAAHGLTAGDEVYFSGMGSLTTFINGDASGVGAYFVLPGATSTTFTVGLRVGGAAVSGAASGGSVHRRSLARGTTIEYRPAGADLLRSLRIVSQVDLTDLDWLRGAADRVYYSTHPYNWPDVLTDARYICVATDTFTGDPVGDVALKLTIKEGPRGPSRARITERYTSNPSAPGFIASLPAVTRFKPQAQSLGMVRVVASGGSAQLSARTFTIPATLHEAMTIPVDAFFSPVVYTQAGYIEQSIPASEGYTDIPSGWIVADVQPDQMDHGMWLIRIIEVSYG